MLQAACAKIVRTMLECMKQVSYGYQKVVCIPALLTVCTGACLQKIEFGFGVEVVV